jgi:hypothetical protein
MKLEYAFTQILPLKKRSPLGIITKHPPLHHPLETYHDLDVDEAQWNY